MKKLGQYDIPVAILKETGVGKLIQQLVKHSDKQIALLALRLKEELKEALTKYVAKQKKPTEHVGSLENNKEPTQTSNGSSSAVQGEQKSQDPATPTNHQEKEVPHTALEEKQATETVETKSS